MSTNIIEAVQKQMGYRPLNKISPNTQEPEQENSIEFATPLQQAVVTSVLVGIYQKAKKQTDDASWVNVSTNLLDEIFGVDKENVITAVANYAHVGTEKATNELHHAAIAAIENINAATDHGDNEKVKAYLTDQRTNILSYLPAALQMGELLNDNTIDDRTNKMEGPVSGFMHTIEKIFSSSN